MTAAEVKEALRRRHPAMAEFGPGPWTCIEEWHNIDLLAFAAWTQPKPARCRHARVGYEVKVSRADYKRELIRPYKRAGAVAFCHEFYMAIPAGLLHPEEREWLEPPGWPTTDNPYERIRCPGSFGSHCSGGRVQFGTVRRPLPHYGLGRHDYSRTYDVECETCRGAGWIIESPAVRWGAPRLWVPSDVGLVEIDERGRCAVVRKAPLNEDPSPIADQMLTNLIRWVSVRPDPRHAVLHDNAPVDLLEAG